MRILNRNFQKINNFHFPVRMTKDTVFTDERCIFSFGVFISTFAHASVAAVAIILYHAILCHAQS